MRSSQLLSGPFLLPVLATALAVAVVSPALGQDAGEDPGTISLAAVGSLLDERDSFGSLIAPVDIEVFAISNQTYALAAGSFGIHILDVTDPGSPSPVTEIQVDRDEPYWWESPDHAGVFATNGHTYAIVVSSDALRIINITVPDAPAEVTAIRNGQDNFYALRHLPLEQAEEILGDYPDARDLSYSWDQPFNVEILATPSGRTYTLLSSMGDDTLQIIDVTRPQTPVLVASMQDGLDSFYALSHPSDVETFTVSGHVYIMVASRGENAIQIIDITDPVAPVPAASVRDGQDGLYSVHGPTDIETFAASGKTYALVSGYGQATLQIIDVTDPYSPRPVATIREGQDGFAAPGLPVATFAASGHTYALLSSSHTLQIIDVTDPYSPRPVATIQDDYGLERVSHFNDVEVFAASEGTYALVSGSGDDAIRIIDITDPGAPAPAATIRGGLPVQLHRGGLAEMDIFTASGHTYALVPGSGDDAIRIIDITDPGAPAPAATIREGQDGFDYLSSPLSVEAFTASGETYALVSGWRYGVVQILNVTDPQAPLPMTRLWDGSGNTGIFVSSNRTYALLTAGNTIQIVNLTDPASPSTISGTRSSDIFFRLEGTTSMGIFTVSGHTYALVPPRFGHELLVADITDVEAPALLDPVEVEPGRFYFHFTDPTDVDTFADHGRTFALITNYSDFEPVGTLQILDVTRPQAPVLLANILGGQDGFDTLGAPTDVEAFTSAGRTYALVVDHGFGSGGSIQVIDITDPGDPLPVITIRAGQDGFDAMDDPVDIETFVIDGTTYALVSNPGGSALQVISLTGQGAAP